MELLKKISKISDIIMGSIFQLLWRVSSIVNIAGIYIFAIVLTYITEDLPVEFMEKLLIGSFENIRLLIIISWVAVTCVKIIRHWKIGPAAILCWAVNSVGVLLGGCCIYIMSLHALSYVESAGISDMVLFFCFISLINIERLYPELRSKIIKGNRL